MNKKYDIPFMKNEWYKTICEISGLLETFPKGLEIKYKATGYSIYDGMIGFFFQDREGNDRRWDIYASLDPTKEAKGKFKQLL